MATNNKNRQVKEKKTTGKKIRDGVVLGFFVGLFFIVPIFINLLGARIGAVIIGSVVAVLLGLAVEFYTS